MLENENARIENFDNQETDTAPDYISAIKEMKENSVDRSVYEKLKSENKQLLDALVNGQQIDIKPEEKPDINDLRKKLFDKDGNLSNLEYIDTALKLRKALIDAGERDPFLPYGDKVNVTAEMYDKAQAVADGLQECVDFADGDSGLFTAEYQRRTRDVLPRYGRK